MNVKFLPWKWLVRRAARSHDLIDPFTVLARLRKFAEPSEVEAPLELIRAWTVFQARGVVNTRAIQHNLDWIWPFWVEKQFNPRDTSFIPRSFSFAHINLTHRNWTAVCLPDQDFYSLVDPRGLVTPMHDGWSLDAWIVGGGQDLIPSRCHEARQSLRCKSNAAIETELEEAEHELKTVATMQRDSEDAPCLTVNLRARSKIPAMLCVALRPYNPEGIQFIDSVQRQKNAPGWIVNRKTEVRLDRDPDRYAASTYKSGDVFHRILDAPSQENIECPVGMATAAALFSLDGKTPGDVSVTVPLGEITGSRSRTAPGKRPRTSWKALVGRSPVLDIPDKRMAYLYGTAMHTLLSLSAGEVYPGSYTYRRFWFRDACIMLHALLALNHEECFVRAFENSFLRRQTLTGFFQSQEGEWDSNGQVLWLAGRYRALSGKTLPPGLLKALRKGADWLCRKRQAHRGDSLHDGLLPPGFSAEHLGPNNYYYWDNFWGLAGLRAAGDLFREVEDAPYAEKLKSTADEYQRDIRRSMEAIPEEDCKGAIPAAPNRRMDAGAVGSLVADYPLKLFGAGDERIMKTVEFLLGNCMIENGFFHDMTHSGINPYLTLYMAQVLLRAGDTRYIPLVRRVAELASPTGQWPEAVHPQTGGGCMGDGQHGWAAAEWVLMIRSLFVREEANHLAICPGLFPEWLRSGETLRFGPTATRFGAVRIQVDTREPTLRVAVEGKWHGQQPQLVLSVPKPRHATLEVTEAP